MHCYLEIASGSRHEWIAHLKGAVSLVQFHQQHDQSAEPIFSSATLEFVHEYFSLRDTFSATALDEKSYSEDRTWNLQIPRPITATKNPSKINVEIGLSRELLDIISCITSLARSKYRLRRQGLATVELESSFHDHAVALLQRLDGLQQWSDEPNPEHLLYQNATAFKEAVYIYLRHGAFDDATYHPSIQEGHLLRLLGLLERIHKQQGDQLGTLPYPMWSLFIASCVVKEQDRAVTLGYFADLKRCRPISNVPTTMAAVESVWKMQDLEAGRASQRARVGGLRIRFEWGEALSKLGWKMPLT